MNYCNLNQSDFSVDILDLFYQNEDDDIFQSLRKKLNLSLDMEMEESPKSVKSHQPLISRIKEPSDLSGYSQKGIWEKTTDWIMDNPGTALTGALLLGSGIAYLFNRHKDKSSTTIEAKIRRKRKTRVEELSSINTVKPETEEGNEVAEVSTRNKIAAAVTAAVASVTFDEISVAVSAPVIGYGLWQDHSLMVYAGVGLLAGCLLRKILFKSDVKKLSKSQKGFNAARDPNDIYAPKYVEAIGGVIFSEHIRPEDLTEEEKALYKHWDTLHKTRDSEDF